MNQCDVYYLQIYIAFLFLDPYPAELSPMLKARQPSDNKLLENLTRTLGPVRRTPLKSDNDQTIPIESPKVFRHMYDKTRVLLDEFYKPFNILLADLLQDRTYLEWNVNSNK